mgnify:CR=1 FL=1
MAEKTVQELISDLNFFDLVKKIKTLFTKINIDKLSASQAENVATLGTTTNLTAISATYADLPAARTSVNTLKTEVEARLDTIEAKVDELNTKLQDAGIIATS